MRIRDWSSDVCSSDLALMTPEQREVADKHIGLDASGTSTEISTLVNEGHVVLVDPDQLTEVQEIQSAFDAGRVGQLTKLLEVRGLKWTGMSEEEALELEL